MQLTTFLLLLAAVIDALDAQYFQQGTQQFYQPPQQHYNEWQRWQQPQFYPPQQPQHFFPAQACILFYDEKS
ncbi:hypothetical protein DICVIV_09365 [Dictyocaulus viviparus]|uniref:Uncharacterized protein n=1 Tax=Dictyocaulus viviparus TaxID=29172 RepID=A0A0D8XJ63_DICVI|nr:hypothetical protein DICVIV_09365 [Dictyocaulus viviparus]